MYSKDEIAFRVASSSREFVGYWGYAENSSWLLQQLATPSAKITHNPGFISLSAGGFSVDSHPSAEKSEKTDTQSKIQNPKSKIESDAWVQVEEDTLTLSREPFGRMPLYWLQVEEIIWFASKLQLLLPLIAVPEVNIAGLYGYSCFSYVPTPLTPVERINAVEAGTELIWQAGDRSKLLAPEFKRIWQWEPQTEQITDEREAIAQLQTLLRDTIERQIADLPDAPVGVCLSGGLDSSIVAALLVQAGVKVRAYTLDFGGSGIPEHPFAQQVAQWLDIPLIKVDATPKRVKSVLSDTVKALDLPFGDGVTAPLFLLNRLASEEVGVIFNGEGGDQLFAGWTNKPLIAARLYQDYSLKRAYLPTFHRLWGYEAGVFQSEIYEEVKNLQAVKWIEPALEVENDCFLHKMRRAGLMLKGAQNIQPRATNLALACGLSVRSPFCDLNLAQWTFGLAGELCLQGACEKYILKKAVESWLPDEIVWRQKRGMGVPLTSWCLNEWWRSLGVWLNPDILTAEGRWQPDLAYRVALGRLGGQIQGRRIGEILWLLIMWQLWRVEVLKEPIGRASINHPFWLPYKFWRYWGVGIE